jgi:putative ABC transport system permease protein
MYTPISRAGEILLPERHRLTFVLAQCAPWADAREVAARIEKQTGLRARTRDDFKYDTVVWYLINCEDVGDVTTMLVLAITVGFGVTGVMLYMFTQDSLKQYAVLKAMGATKRMLVFMILAQTATCCIVGTGIGLGVCGVASFGAGSVFDLPFRMLWWTPLAGGVAVVLVGMVSAALSMRPVFKLEPASVFSGR